MAENISCEVKSRCSTSTANISIFTYATFASQICLVFDSGEEFVVLHVIPYVLEFSSLDVAESISIVIAARNGVSVFCYGHKFSKKAAA